MCSASRLTGKDATWFRTQQAKLFETRDRAVEASCPGHGSTGRKPGRAWSAGVEPSREEGRRSQKTRYRAALEQAGQGSPA